MTTDTQGMKTFGGGLVALSLAAAVFQLFFRYAYVQDRAALIRIDRLTQQTCRVRIMASEGGPGYCDSQR